MIEFENTKPRKIMHLPKHPDYVPQKETIEKMCIVTGADHNYFEIMVELIESLKATKSYNTIPINIIDCGLKPSDIEYLTPLLSGGRIINPGWYNDFQKVYKADYNSWSIYTIQRKDYLKGVCNKPYLNKIFPGYKYYLWINPNFWIQDERGLDQHVCLAEKQGFAHSFTSPNEKNMQFKDHPISKQKHFLDQESLQLMKNMPIATDTCFCIDAETGFFEEWQKTMKQSIDAHQGFFYHIGELTIMPVMKKMGMTKYVDMKWINYWPWYNPLVYENEPEVLYSLESPSDPLSIIRPMNFKNFDHTVSLRKNKDNSETFQTHCSTRFRIIESKRRRS